jgi:hypothetical protein
MSSTFLSCSTHLESHLLSALFVTWNIIPRRVYVTGSKIGYKAVMILKQVLSSDYGN